MKRIFSFSRRLHHLPPLFKKMIMAGVDLLLVPFALWCALSLRFGEPYIKFEQSFLDFAALSVFSVLVFSRLGFYRAVTRYLGWQSIALVLSGVVVSSAILLAIMLLHPAAKLPNSTFVIYGLVAFAFISGSRFLARAIIVDERGAGATNVAIYGAGASGQQLLGLLRQAGEYNPRVFLDDDTRLHGRIINGLDVLDPTSEAIEVKLKQLGIDTILLSIPSIGVSARRAILLRLEQLPFQVLTVPGMSDILSGRFSLDQIRDVSIEDVLGRDPVQPRVDLLHKCILDQHVLVTGAGGSIGSELCRQVVEQGARRIVLFELSEFALYTIEQELRGMERVCAGEIEVFPVLGSVQDELRLEEIFSAFAIHTVYHAAAYKHVPLVEHNPVEGVRNNALGTLGLVAAAGRAGVRRFVLISTDKAVRPTNVMGASKRLAEMAVQALQNEYPKTVFSMVRFGNVLGSSGSVIPRFREQIANGRGQLTVTHPEITRFFMTIPEAVQLVIQAGAMAKGGDVFVLDMGQPIRIVDLARSMIRLSGLEERHAGSPDGDIEIVFTGLRPGEKLYEELLIGDAVTGTEHPKIMRAEEDYLPWSVFNNEISTLRSEMDSRDFPAIRRRLLHLVKGYSPHATIEDWIWCQNQCAHDGQSKIS